MEARARMTFKMETITPQMAAEYLSHNAENNRRIKRAHVETLARDMKNGTFMVTHQGIAFDSNGVLIDGQHRLQAIMMAGVPVSMVVARGCSSATLTSVDRGETRTLRDAFSIAGGDSMRDRVLRDTHILAAMNAVIRSNVSKRRRMSASEAIAMYDADSEIWDKLFVIMNRGGRKRGYETAAYYAAMTYGVTAEEIKRYDRCMCNANVAGCEENNVQVVLSLRRYFDDLAMKHIRLYSEPVYLYTQSAIYHFVHNTGGRGLRLQNTERYDVRDKVREIFEGADYVDLS